MTDSFPPANFIPTQSAIDGIEMFMPRPPDEDHRPVVEFNCPQCGSQTAYSATDGGLSCTNCGYHEPPEKAIVGKGAEEFEFTVDTLTRAAHGWGEARKELQCQNCGVYTSLPMDAMTHTCPFCDSNKVIQHRAPQDVLRPRFLVPFKIEANACQSIARGWLGSNWMVPKALNRSIISEPFVGVFIPVWTFDSTLQARWKAEVGRTRTRRTWDGKTRREVVWKWEQGQIKDVVDDLLIWGSTHLSAVLLKQVDDFDLHALAPYEPKYLAGLQAQNYDIPLEEAWESARHQMRVNAKNQCRNGIDSSQVRNFNMLLDFSNESWRYILLPIHLSSYSYRGKAYQVMVNAQSGAIAGQRPVDWLKVGLAMTLALAPAFIAGLIGLLQLTVFEARQTPFITIGFILFIIGVAVALRLLQNALKLNDA